MTKIIRHDGDVFKQEVFSCCAREKESAMTGGQNQPCTPVPEFWLFVLSAVSYLYWVNISIASVLLLRPINSAMCNWGKCSAPCW